MSDFSSIYNKHTWKNGQSPALNDSNLNDIETFMEIVDERTRDLDTRQTAITPEVVASLVLAPAYAAEASAGAREARQAADEAQTNARSAERSALEAAEKVSTLQRTVDELIVIVGGVNAEFNALYGEDE